MDQKKNTNTALSGMKEICGYLKRSERTVLNLIRLQKFPAKKLGGVWESDKELIHLWRKKQIQHQANC